MTDETKAALDTLYKEFQRINSKSLATDDWFFRFLSIAVVPFLVFLAYCLVTPAYRIFVAMLPFLSLIGVTVVAVLTTHYLYAESYGEYLEARINEKLGANEIRNAEFGRACYKGWHSPVTISYVVGLGLLVILNIFAIPVIEDNKGAFLGHYGVRLGWAALLIEYYWPITLFCITITATALVASLLRVNTLTRKLLGSGYSGVAEQSGGTRAPEGLSRCDGEAGIGGAEAD